LELDGWRAIRTDPVSDRSRAKGFGEIGMPDYLFIRYVWFGKPPFVAYSGTGAQVLWVEFKAPGKHASQHQVEWHKRESQRGGMVIVEDDVDDFREWYKTSGLMRNTILS